jgi:exodeoxyribonuclease-3
MKIATWNVNSIKARLPVVTKWLEETAPDVACLQEIKCLDENFPGEAFEDLGYNVAVHGQKTYNGVAILSKTPMEDVSPRLPGDESDEQARYLEALISTDKDPLRVGCLYLPNGNPVSEPKYAYKLAWMDRLIARAQELLSYEERFILCGDYNVIPSDDDVHDPKGWWGDALYRQETLDKFRELTNLGLTEAFRTCHATPHRYSFWDYQRGAWQKDHGIRIDHLLLSPQAADQLQACDIDQYVRGWEKPSDHVPVWVELSQ